MKYPNDRRESFGDLKKTLRLNKTGLAILSQIMEFWQLKLPEKFETSCKNLLALDGKLTGPWYLEKKLITLFSPDDTILLKMIDADFNMFDDLR